MVPSLLTAGISDEAAQARATSSMTIAVASASAPGAAVLGGDVRGVEVGGAQRVVGGLRELAGLVGGGGVGGDLVVAQRHAPRPGWLGAPRATGRRRRTRRLPNDRSGYERNGTYATGPPDCSADRYTGPIRRQPNLPALRQAVGLATILAGYAEPDGRPAVPAIDFVPIRPYAPTRAAGHRTGSEVRSERRQRVTFPYPPTQAVPPAQPPRRSTSRPALPAPPDVPRHGLPRRDVRDLLRRARVRGHRLRRRRPEDRQAGRRRGARSTSPAWTSCCAATSPPAGCASRTDYREVAEFGDVHFICVGTPQRARRHGRRPHATSRPRSPRWCRT